MTRQARCSGWTWLLMCALAGCGGQPVASTARPAAQAAPSQSAVNHPAAPGGGGGAAAPLPLAPLTAAAPGSATVAPGPIPTAPAPGVPAPASVDSSHLTILDTALNGDATRIVYPQPTLDAGKLYPALIFAHGYGMDQTQLTDRTELANAAAAQGWISASGAFGGKAAWANDTAMKQVGALIAELVANHQVDPKRIYLTGFSMGGGTALLAATNPLGLPYKPAAVVSTQGFTDLEAMTQPEADGGHYAPFINEAYGGQLTTTTAAQHSPLDQADKLMGIPVYLEHGEADVNVPPTHSTRMADKLQSLGMTPELHTYPGMSHGEETIHTQSIIDFLQGKQTN